MAKRVATRTWIVVFLLAFGLAWSEAAPPVHAVDPPAGSLAARGAELWTRGVAPARKLSSAQASADLVVLVSLDGFRPDVIAPDMHALHKLYLQGASPHIARTIDKSATLPSHASMVSGVDPSQHGLDFNSYRPDHANIELPHILPIRIAPHQQSRSMQPPRIGTLPSHRRGGVIIASQSEEYQLLPEVREYPVSARPGYPMKTLY